MAPATSRSSGASRCRSLRPALSALGIITFTQSLERLLPGRACSSTRHDSHDPAGRDGPAARLHEPGQSSVVMAAMSMSILPVVLLFLAGPEDA